MPNTASEIPAPVPRRSAKLPKAYGPAATARAVPVAVIYEVRSRVGGSWWSYPIPIVPMCSDGSTRRDESLVEASRRLRSGLHPPCAGAGRMTGNVRRPPLR